MAKPKRLKLYQAGPMRGLDNYNFQAFEDGAVFLRSLGHVVISPHDIDIEEGLVTALVAGEEDFYQPWQSRKFLTVELTERFTIERALRRDFAAICQSDALSCLPGWRESDGTQKEIQVARWIGLPVYEHDPVACTFELSDV